MNRYRPWLIGAALVVVLAAAFLWVDFHAARSATNADHSPEKYSYSRQDEEIALPRQVSVYVAGDDACLRAGPD